MHWMKGRLENEREIILNHLVNWDKKNLQSNKHIHDTIISEKLSQFEYLKLRKINVALDRINNGDFGICTACGEEIQKKRLEALLMATECINCAI